MRRRTAAAAPAAVEPAAPAQPQIQNLHKFALFQHLLPRHAITEERAIQVLRQLINNADAGTLAQLTHDHNRELEPLHLRYKRLKNPVDGVVYIGLVNTVSDAAAKFGTQYKHQQLEYFRQVLETIAAAPDAEEGVGNASQIQLLNLAPPQHEDVQAADGSQLTAGRALTKVERETTLRQLVRDQWLAHCPHQAGHYCIGLRSFLELSSMLLNMDVPTHTKEAWEARL